MAGRLLPRAGRDRGRPAQHQARPRRALHRPPPNRPNGRRPLGHRHGRRGPGDSDLAGGRRVRRADDRDRRARALGVGPLAGAASPRRKGDPARPGPLPPPQLQDRDLPAGAPEHHPGRRDDRAADLSPDLARIQRAGDRPDPRSALSDDVRGSGSRGAEGRGSPPCFDHPLRLRAQHPRHGIARPDRARGELRLVSGRPADAGRDRARAVGFPAQQLHARPDRRGADQRGGRGELGGGVLRALVRTGDGGGRAAGGPLAQLHQHDRGKHRDPGGPAAADRGKARRRRGSDEQCETRTAPRRRAGGGSGRSPQHQHGRDEPLPAGGTVGSDHRRPDRALQFLPDDAAAGNRAAGLDRGRRRWAEREAGR